MSKITVIPPFEVPLSENGLPCTFYDYLDFERQRNNLPEEGYSPSVEERKKIAKVAIIHAVVAGLLTPVKLMPEGVPTLQCNFPGGIDAAKANVGELVNDTRYIPLVKAVLDGYVSARETQVEDFMGRFSTSRWSKANKQINYARVVDVIDFLERRLRDDSHQENYVFSEFNHLIKPSIMENTYFTSTALVTTGAVGVGTAFLLMGNPIPLLIAAGVAAATHGDIVVDAVKKSNEKKALEDPNKEVVMHSDIEIFIDYLNGVEPNGSKYLYEENDSSCTILEHLVMLDSEDKWIESFAKRSGDGILIGDKVIENSGVSSMMRAFKQRG